ncbi:hypothetical protein BGW80DRAFT_1249328 [Lactifluus volemus]|nr:hypothetical protein BGW80DRAFT_1249328 [Lactifluus volemus]
MTPSSYSLPLSKESDSTTKAVDEDTHHDVPKDWKFWCIIFSLALSFLLPAIEFTAIGTALQQLFVNWKENTLVPLCGGLSQIIGRRPIMLSALFLFALGSTICATASSMNMLILEEGLGGGAIRSVVQILLSDLVTLRERGTFTGLMALQRLGNWWWRRSCHWWGIGSERTMAQPAHMCPHCNSNLALLACQNATCNLREKLSKMDLIGNILIIGSITSVVIGLAWGGVRYPWTSIHVLVPLIIGFVGLSLVAIYEFYFCHPPVVPILMRLDWTGTSGYLQIFMTAVVTAGLIYWYPVFFEACKETSPTEAGIALFGLSYSIGLIAIVTGLVVKKSGNYAIPTYVGWVLTVVGVGLLTTLDADSSMAKSIGFQLVTGSGIGIINVTSLYPILASIPVTQNAPAMALYVFSRNLGTIWGVTIGGAILQNKLPVKPNLPGSFIAQDFHVRFSAIPIIPTLSSSLKDPVRNTSAEALKVVWQALLGISIAGFLCSLGMRQLKLHSEIDEDWGRSDVTPPLDLRSPQRDTDMSKVNGNVDHGPSEA